MIERHYFFNLLVKNHTLDDTEKVQWTLHGDTKYLDLSSNTMHFKKDNCYITPNVNAIIDTRKFTISIKYKIDRVYIEKSLSRLFKIDVDEFLNGRTVLDFLDSKRTDIAVEETETLAKYYTIHTLAWDNGHINLLEYINDEMFIVIEIDGQRFIEPVNYVKYDDWNHLLISYKDQKIHIFHNGIRKEIVPFQNPSFVFKNFKFGNYEIQNFRPQNMIEYSELVMVNDCLYTEEFTVPEQPIHILFPEVVYEDIEKDPVYDTLVSAPYLFSTKDSMNDIFHHIEITRHKKFIPNKTMQMSKYHFEEG